MGLWYLSFSSPKRWLGGCFLLANSAEEAINRSWDLGLNPGGEVLLAPAIDPDADFDPRFLDRLLHSIDDVEAACGGKAHRLTTDRGKELAGGYFIIREGENERP